MASFSDDFNRADGGLGSNWTTVGAQPSLSIFSNAVRGSSAPIDNYANVVAPATASFGPNQEASAVVSGLTAFDWAGLLVRTDPTLGTGYGVRFDGRNDGTCILFRLVGATLVALGTVKVRPVNGDRVTLRAIGPRISVYIGDALIDSVIDLTHTSGQPGIFYRWEDSGVTRLDDFTADDVTASTRTVFTDNFNRSNGGLLPNWKTGAGLQHFLIVSNQVRGNSSVTRNCDVVNVDRWMFTADQEASVTYGAVFGADLAGPCVRYNAQSNNGYGLELDGLTDNIRRLKRYDAGVATTIGSASYAIVAGDRVRLRIVGSTITVYLNNVLIETVVDATYTAGNPGMTYSWTNVGGTYLDNFLAYDLSDPVLPTVRTRYVNTNSTAGGDGTTNATTGANRAYATLAAALTAQAGNIATSNEQVDIVVGGGGEDTTQAVISGWTTNARCFLRITPQPDERATRRWSTSKYRLSCATSTTAINITGGGHIRIERMQIENTTVASAGSSNACIRSGGLSQGAGETRIVGNYLRKVNALSTAPGSATRIIDYGNASAGQILVIMNNVMVGNYGALLSLTTDSAAGLVVCNNTYKNGFVSGTTMGGLYMTAYGARDFIILKNNLGVNTSAANYYRESTWLHENIERNVSRDATAFADSVGGRLWTRRVVEFNDEGNGDFTLAPNDTGAQGAGVDLTLDRYLYDITDDMLYDMEGTLRTGRWNVGAFQNAHPAKGINRNRPHSLIATGR